MHDVALVLTLSMEVAAQFLDFSHTGKKRKFPFFSLTRQTESLDENNPYVKHPRLSCR